jgi:DNA-binding transcriptional regulator PaaX
MLLLYFSFMNHSTGIPLYGDALLQRGGEVWLGSVAALLEGLGFGERFVRTVPSHSGAFAR